MLERLIKEYLSKCNACDECYIQCFCIENQLRKSRKPQDYCVENFKRYLESED